MISLAAGEREIDEIDDDEGDAGEDRQCQQQIAEQSQERQVFGSVPIAEFAAFSRSIREENGDESKNETAEKEVHHRPNHVVADGIERWFGHDGWKCSDGKINLESLRLSLSLSLVFFLLEVKIVRRCR